MTPETEYLVGTIAHYQLLQKDLPEVSHKRIILQRQIDLCNEMLKEIQK